MAGFQERRSLIKLLQIDSIRKAGTGSKADDSPRVFALHKYALDNPSGSLSGYHGVGTDKKYRNFYQMRVDRLRNIEMAKRNQERMKNPSLFPSVPTGDI